MGDSELSATDIENRPLTGELADAIKLAECVLDRPNGDPDDDLAVLSRQFLRGQEKITALLKMIAITNRRSRRSPVAEGGGWLPIDSADGKPCWIGHSPSGSMSPAYRDDRCLGVWRVWRTGKLISWMPTHWQPLPSPPAPSQEGASDTGEQT